MTQYDKGWNKGERRGLRKSVEILFREMPRNQKFELLETLMNSLPPKDKDKLLASL